MTAATRRTFLKAGAAALASAGWADALAQVPGARPPHPRGVEVMNPKGRVPVSLIVDDSTCLVNLAHFAIPQFAEVFPDQYRQPWATLPREIPDAFVREFGEWCHSRGVKGKYSVVPYPACVGWLDRELPGWSRPQLDASLDLVRTLMAPDWDIHPEMVSHTRVIDTRTGRPFPERSDRFMENWRWTDGKSVDQLADYLAYALRILRDVGLPCEGITTPGGFGNRVLPELAQATLHAVRDVFAAEVPHYFRHVITDERSVAPRVEYAAGLDGPDPRCVVSIIGCTDDWFGGWDGLEPGEPDRFLTADGKRGRLAEVIARGEPAVLVGHWPGFYFNGKAHGFRVFREVVDRLRATYDHLLWMKLSALSRYWAARELTRFTRDETTPGDVVLNAPFACPSFTFRVKDATDGPGEAAWSGGPLRRVERLDRIEAGTYVKEGRDAVFCVDLPKGRSRVGG